MTGRLGTTLCAVLYKSTKLAASNAALCVACPRRARGVACGLARGLALGPVVPALAAQPRVTPQCIASICAV